MRTLLTVCYLLVPTAAMGACQNREQKMSEGQEQAQYFASAGEAVDRAQADLVSFLRSKPDVDLGVSEAAITRARPGKAVPRVELDFQKLLAADPTRPIEELVASQ